MEYKKIKNKKELTKLLSFLIMCDGGVYKTKDCKNFKFIMNTTSISYAKYAKSIIENITSVRIIDRPDYNTDGANRKQQYRVESKTHPVFTILRNRLYKNNYKTIDVHSLKLMDPECLAMLYMADGSISYKGEAINSVTLNTKRLTEGDNMLLISFIDKKFNIKSTLNRQNQYSYIRIKGKSLFKFFNIIKPFILQDFLYKIPNDKLLLKYKQDDDIV